MRSSKPSLNRKQINSPKISIEKLQAALEVEAKRANTRLRAIEKSGLEKPSHAYKAIRDYAADGRSFVKTDKSGNLRFNRSVKGRTREELQEELNQLHAFLYESKTSTVSGVKKTDSYIKARTQAQNVAGTKSQKVQDFFKNMNEEQFKEFWDLSNLTRLYDMLGSDETVEIIEKIKENKYIGDDWDMMNKAIGEIFEAHEKSVKTGLVDGDISIESWKDLVDNFVPTGVVE